MTEATTRDPIRVAGDLRLAESTREPIAPPSAGNPELSVEDAYRIQLINREIRLSAGEVRAGLKIGLTSAAMQKQLGVDQPDFGFLTDRMMIANGSEFDTTELIAPRIEAEFAFRIGSSLPPSPTIEQLREAIDGVAVALEIIDSRVADWKITLVDTIADNASSARVVHGPFRAATVELLDSLPDSVITMTEDGSERASGPGSAVLGDPVVSLHWLAGAIGGFGDSFQVGDIVIAGAVAAAVPLTSGATFIASVDGFDPVRVSTTASE